MEKTALSDSILEMNRDMEAAVIQGGYGRSMFFHDPYRNLQFVHFADVHAVPDHWNRIVEYINHYADYIDFALHTGDYCGGDQKSYVDFYRDCAPCEKVIYNCVGNHDTVEEPGWRKMPKERAHALLFNHTEDWDVTFMDIPHAMTYCKDLPDSHIRLLVLDLYFDREAQADWLRDRLAEAREAGLHVITAMHEPTDEIATPEDTTFHSLGDYLSLSNCWLDRTPYDAVIADFIRAGGIHVCNLCGHCHHDLFGYTASGVLNVAVECATSWHHWCDGRRVKGTRTYDAFNLVAVDPNMGYLKLTRIGDNVDNFMRIKRTLCYDYLHKKMIFTDR